MSPITKVFSVSFLGAGLFATALYLGSCGVSTTTDDVSVGGVAAGAVGAALAGTSAAGTQSYYTPNLRGPLDWFGWIPDAYAAGGACPTLATVTTGCASATNAATLTYSGCRFGTSLATWSGILQVSGSGVSCGTFPTATVTRQFVVSAGGAASQGTRTTFAGKVFTIDHSTTDLGNYQSDAITTLVNSGYGTSVSISGGVRTGVSVKQRLTSTLMDASVNGTLTVTETASATTRTVSGSVVTYHNLLKVKGTTAFSSVVYNDTCCTPVSGTITTTLASTSASETAGIALDGKTERLVFTSCGVATSTNTSGTSSAVAVTGCY